MIRVRSICIALCFLAALCSNGALGQTAAQSMPVASPILSVGGDVERPLKLSLSDLAKLSRRVVRAQDHEGKEAAYEGVSLVEILQLAGVKFGENLRGKRLATYLLVEAADGYQAVFALPELDPAFTDRVVLLADRRDSKPLSTLEGPLRIIIPDEKRHARWVRQVTSLTIRRV